MARTTRTTPGCPQVWARLRRGRHNWYAIAAPAALATVKLFLLTWLIIIVMLTLGQPLQH